MKALTCHCTEDVRVDEVPNPSIQHPTDAIVRITSTAICASGRTGSCRCWKATTIPSGSTT